MIEHPAEIRESDYDLCHAMAALHKRKLAAYGARLSDMLNDPEPLDLTPLFVGTGLTYEHTAAHASDRVTIALRELQALLEQGADLTETVANLLCGGWVEGLLTGLMVAERRAKREAQPQRDRADEQAMWIVVGLFGARHVSGPAEFVAELDRQVRWQALWESRPPLWTRQCAGVSEAERDRRRAARGRR